MGCGRGRKFADYGRPAAELGRGQIKVLRRTEDLRPSWAWADKGSAKDGRPAAELGRG